jgi:DNA repair photolyase
MASREGDVPARQRLRWTTVEEDVEGRLPGLEPSARVTHPEFRDMEFLHVEARSLLNEVPAAAGLPFRWTINTYRGCSHACSYCLAGDTPVLLGDGRTLPISELRPGMGVIGTRVSGSYRRYTPTTVLAHWQTTKRAYRVTLADGTQLVASGDHRFLTERGWKHVTGSGAGRGRRPHLTVNNKLIGTGFFAEPPKACRSYAQGYLSGMIRGDANLATYHYDRPGRVHGDVHRFRLALTDREGLDRTRDYLASFGIEVDGFRFSAATNVHREINALRTSKKASVERIQDLIAWPDQPDEGWRKGFLAGIFDAEGSCSQGVFRISNADEEILEWTRCCLDAFGFEHELECPRPGIYCIRLLGGLRARHRFFHLTDPAISRKRSIEGRAVKSDAPLQVERIEDLGVDVPMFDITTGTGDFIANGVISHNCFARPSHEWLELDSGRDFERVIVVKVNAVARLRAELRRPSWRGEPIALGTNTDPYQRAEGRYRLTRGVLETLVDAGNPFSVLTKGTLVTRDLDLLAEAARRGLCRSVSMSIPTLDEDVWRASEPGTPHPKARMEAIAALADAGITTGVMVAPIIPGLSDSEAGIDRVVRAAVDAGASHVTPIVLHLRPGVREVFAPWLADLRPDLVESYRDWYRGTYAPKRLRGEIAARVQRSLDRHGPLRAAPRARTSAHDHGAAAPAVAAPTEQLSLLS